MKSEDPLSSNSQSESFMVGEWLVDPTTRRLSKGDQTVSLEPKVMDLLVVLASSPGIVFSRADIERVLWADVIVGEDSLARTLSKLRRALGDNAHFPEYIETIAKRGYRLITPVSSIKRLASKDQNSEYQKLLKPLLTACLLIGLAAVFTFQTWVKTQANSSNSQIEKSQAEILTSRADDLYMRFTRQDNEAAIAIYQRVIANSDEYAPAQAGLANALVQRVIRWPGKPGQSNNGADSLTDALERGLTQTSSARDVLARATAMAERAARLSPDDASVLKALGLSYSAQGDLDRAEKTYRKALNIDKDIWEVMINLGEILNMRNDREGAIKMFEKAYAAMERTYHSEPQRIGPWQAALGVLIADHYEAIESYQDAEIWYRRVLVHAPLEPEATIRLAQILRRTGELDEAKRLCQVLNDKIGQFDGCQ